MPSKETLGIFEKKCRKGEHPFEKITTHDYFDKHHPMDVVARWCPVCGTVTVDLVNPMPHGDPGIKGYFMKATKPKMLE